MLSVEMIDRDFADVSVAEVLHLLDGLDDTTLLVVDFVPDKDAPDPIDEAVRNAGGYAVLLNFANERLALLIGWRKEFVQGYVEVLVRHAHQRRN